MKNGEILKNERFIRLPVVYNLYLMSREVWKESIGIIFKILNQNIPVCEHSPESRHLK